MHFERRTIRDEHQMLKAEELWKRTFFGGKNGKEERGQAPPRSFLKRQTESWRKGPSRRRCPLGVAAGSGASPFILSCSARTLFSVTRLSNFFWIFIALSFL